MALYGGITIPNRPDPENQRKLDLLPVPMIRKMQRYGFAIDIDYLADLSNQFELELIDKRKAIASYVPSEKLDLFCGMSDSIGSEDDDESAFNPNSGDQLAALLFDVLGVGSNRRLKTTKGGDRLSTGKKQLELLKKDHPIVPEILRYREIAKLKSTYADSLPKLAIYHPAGKDCPICRLKHNYPTYRVHTQLLTTRTATNRLASKRPNQQNIPIRTKEGAKIRQAFIASRGTVIAQRDFAQIELRLLGHVSQDSNIIRIFIADGDIHLDTACRAFNLEPSQIDKMLHRAPCKNVNFGICYGLSAPGLYDLMLLTYATAGQPTPDWLTVDWCDEFIKLWFNLYPDVERYMAEEDEKAYRYGCVWTDFGFVRRIPGVRSVHSRVQAAALREGGNVRIQGTAAAIMKLAMAAIDERLDGLRNLGYWAWPLLTVHDELLIECDPDIAEAVQCIMEDEMDNVMVDRKTGINQCLVPIKSDGAIMERWTKG